MSLNIKNPEAHALAARLAKKTGETLTEAVTTALRERLDAARADDGDFDEAALSNAQGDRGGQPQALERCLALDRARRSAL